MTTKDDVRPRFFCGPVCFPFSLTATSCRQGGALRLRGQTGGYEFGAANDQGLRQWHERAGVSVAREDSEKDLLQRRRYGQRAKEKSQNVFVIDVLSGRSGGRPGPHH